VEKKHRIFQRRDGDSTFKSLPGLPEPGSWQVRMAAAPPTPPTDVRAQPLPSARCTTACSKPSRRRACSSTPTNMLEAFASPSVLVNADYDIVHLSEHAGRYLRFSGGDPSRNLLKVA